MPVVALLTDFGTRDHYVGTMKGVVLSVCPSATIVDITHEVAPQDVAGAALELAAAYRYFPAATVFLGVVDPGVGSDRRGIAAVAGGYSFVGPDNGLFSHVFRDAPPSLVVELREPKFARSTISPTFEGRDRFAPAAGWLARGADLRAFGPRVSDPVMLVFAEPRVTARGIDGEVLRVDRFGNLITNVDQRTLAAFADTRVQIEIAGRRIAGVVRTYAEAASGDLCALLGSSGYLEVALNGGNAAEVLDARRGDAVRIVPAAI